MSCTWGQSLTLSIFGESHGAGVGVVIDGLPPGFAPDMEHIAREMARRAPGRDELTTPRTERDSPEILSGILEGKTTGAPLCVFIRNENTVSGDYSPAVLRPGHADLTAFYKFKGFADHRGGGHFSGRLTAPLVFAGAIAKQLLGGYGITVGARVYFLGNIKDVMASPEDIVKLPPDVLPVIDAAAGKAMRETISHAKEEGDSVGGVIECVALALPAGIGSPFFASMESVIASMMFSIPAVKGVEFGDGFALAAMRGSEANDGMCVENGQIKLSSNHNGGITGGITNGAPLVVRVAVKPTPTIHKAQQTVDIGTMENTMLRAKGRHDPCIVPRAVPVVEAGLALCVLDAILSDATLSFAERTI